MSSAVAERQNLGTAVPVGESPSPIQVTERAAKAVQSVVNQQRLDCLEHLTPELAESYRALQTKKGGAPDMSEFLSAIGMSEQDFRTKLGAAAFAKGDPLPEELSRVQHEFAAANGRAPTSAELASKAGVSESEMFAKIGKSASHLLGSVYLRLRTIGAGCSGMQDKLDLDPEYNEKRDVKFEFHGCPVVVDKRSLLYVSGSTIDFHNELNRSGFSINNPNRKSTCGCGSSYSM